MKKEYLDLATTAVTKTAIEIKKIENEREIAQASKSGVFKKSTPKSKSPSNG